MFWRRRAAAKEPSKPKVKKLSPKEMIINQINQLTGEQVLCYQLPEVFGGELAIITLNPEYPEKGGKYMLSMGKLVDGKPAGDRRRFWVCDKPKDLASWIVDRMGKLFTSVETETPGS